ncbi:hypothetical protein KVR01_007553 [Diaporthe batatas]|uniref:uncharacterized protein n=1 Tax=Diaporthe batatas TaxID=748121 RepID=UPI001D042B1A|nr:uncharacterized protein KVR01_007553 [Diaporthe batatas]KAG8163075.1 hypothetical protein KVR01_007553 [Diaporthe batatas]
MVSNPGFSYSSASLDMAMTSRCLSRYIREIQVTMTFPSVTSRSPVHTIIMGQHSKSHGSKDHWSKHYGLSNSHNSSPYIEPNGGEMLGKYIYDSHSPSEIPYRGQPKWEERYHEMKNHLDNLDRKYSGQTSYRQAYGHSGTGR